MAPLSDEYNILNMSIPGTHDTLSRQDRFVWASLKTQELSLHEQLMAGVRYLDVRFQCFENEIEIVHTYLTQRVRLGEVLETCY